VTPSIVTLQVSPSSALPDSVRRVTVGEATDRATLPLAVPGASTRPLATKPAAAAFSITSVLPFRRAVAPLAAALMRAASPVATSASDTLARTIIAPAEIPVGVVTSLLGGPFFLWLLVGGARERGGLVEE
jgi:ABC-type enterobactin transport system permease subunit